MKNKLVDLNNHLFAQLERLGDEELKGDDLVEEISRAKAITNVAQQIINNGNLVLGAIKTKEEYFPAKRALPEIFSDTEALPEPHDSGGANANGKKLPERLRAEYES